MKENFNTAGVNNKVTNLLALSSADLHLQKQMLYTDFALWVREHFNLEQEQLEQLDNMPQNFRNQLGTAIANCLDAGYPVQFLKEEKEEDIDWKELSIQGLEEWQEPFMTRQFRSPLFIAIRYKKNP
ncbi:hypothetical protein [Sphingobacterium sp. JUb56]|uniref:hypothetical protein n=1 Tax=Sphingobacterium sp. JUb56 TaxID=2587145 RepID=UPI001615DB10|nr:hypothetical protein [Sphingobacterium sp. JUb56]MBB2949336.1 hypothetical protein [Sphingobacterium sp. JUb56]